MKNSLIEENKTRDTLNKLKKRMDTINRIPQMPRTASLESVIDTINKITDSLKRTR